MKGLDQLRLHAFTAIGGADFVRQRLMNAMSIGNPSLESEAYLLKARVKAVDSLVAKVLERRDEKPGYGAEDARDIVGLRLLCLFRNDLPILVRRFLSFVEWSQRAPFSLFHGAALPDSIEEIKIYATQYLNDPYVGLCLDELATFGFFQEEDLRYVGGVPVEVVRKESSYSSIHIVLWANGPQASFQSRVPVEAQLRTSIEDVWGEIDHRLRYKTRQNDAKKMVSMRKNLVKSKKISHRISSH